MKKEKNGIAWSMMGLALQMGYMIALPLIGLAFFGRFIDKKMQTPPLFFLIGIGLAIIISTVMVINKTKEALNSAEKKEKNAKIKDQNSK